MGDENRYAILRHRATPWLRQQAGRLRRWSGTPGARLLFSGALIAAMLAAAGAAGGYVVPHTAPPPVAALASDAPGGDGASRSDDARGPEDGADPDDGTDPDDDSQDQYGDGDLDDPGADGGYDGYHDPGTAGGTTRPGAAGRPADALAAWAVPIAARLSIPAVSLQAYGYAELVLARTSPSCKLSWTTLAGIGKIESDHGRGAGATLGANGKALPPLLGVRLDGSNGHDRIPDTDGGRLDGDPVWDRAVGPMQFIPSTWQRYAVDADNDGVADPNDIDDAALAAGTYLCASGKDLSTAAGWYDAVLTYNAVRVYAGDVYAAANDYGVRSRR